MRFRKIQTDDKKKASRLFEDCLTELISREGISESGLLEAELMRLNAAVEASLETQYAQLFVAEESGILLGTIGLMPAGPLAIAHAGAEAADLEMGCVYVNPVFQRNGVGNFLFHTAREQAKNAAASRFFLDAGFSSSRTYWTKRLGEPSVILQDFWGPDQPHALWVRNLE